MRYNIRIEAKTKKKGDWKMEMAVASIEEVSIENDVRDLDGL